MAAPRKPASEKSVIRQVSWQPDVDEFLFGLPIGTRSPWLNALVRASKEFQDWSRAR
jgi:hypothetical protein